MAKWRNIEGRWLREVSAWRKISLNTWSAPDNPSVFGLLEVNAGPLLAFLEDRSATAGVKCTVTHAVTRAVAMTMRRYPDVNVFVRGHRVWQREDVDIFLQVAIPADEGSGRADLSGAIIRRADTLRVEEIARQLRDRARAVRERRDGAMAETRSLLQRLPNFATRWSLKALGFLQYDLNLRIPGSPHDPFGSAMVTSVGMLGISTGFAPIVTFSRCPIVVLTGQVEDRAVVRDGAVVASPMCNLAVTFDHRVFDGYQGGLMARMVTSCLEQPEQLDADPREIGAR
jgi:pyruvate dehydrogenase E2 component (dihydrolipoamide acetyltransferase)